MKFLLVLGAGILSLSIGWAQPVQGAKQWPSDLRLIKTSKIEMNLKAKNDSSITHRINFSIVIVRNQNAKKQAWTKNDLIKPLQILNDIYKNSCGIALGTVQIYEVSTKEEKYYSPELNYFDYRKSQEVTDVSLVDLVKALPIQQRPLVLLTEDFGNIQGPHGVAYPKIRVSEDAVLKAIQDVIVIPYSRFHETINGRTQNVNMLTLAHEVTHVVYNCGHNSITGNLMYGAMEEQSTELNPQQCVRMKQYPGLQVLNSKPLARETNVRGMCIPDQMR